MRLRTLFVALVLLLAGTLSLSAQDPAQTLFGSWRIRRIVPTRNASCWTPQQAGALVGTTLTYGPRQMRWHGGPVPLSDIYTRTLTSGDFEQEYTSLQLTDLGIHSPSVTEIDLQHDDADITGASTEVPGDTILLAGRNTIIVSACGVYLEAVRLPSSRTLAADSHPATLR